MTRGFVLRLVGALGGQVWLWLMRRKYGRASRCLADQERAELHGYFSSDTLDRVRISEEHEIRSVLPDWAPRWIADLDPLSRFAPAGITLGDLVVLGGGQTKAADQISVIFHELVHVVQFDEIGTRCFCARYLEQWGRGGYHAIDLERQAYAMQARFDTGESFDAERAVREAL